MSVLPPLPEPPPAPPAPQLEPAAPAKRSKTPFIVAAIVLLAVIGAAVGISAWISAPGRCDAATFTSEQFGYCLSAPAGWDGIATTSQDTPIDQIAPPSGPAVVDVVAIPLSSGQSLDDVVGSVRTQGQTDGHELGETSDREVDGVRAVQWDETVQDSDGAHMVRQVLFSKDDVLWWVVLADAVDTFDQHTDDLQQMLDSWHFT